MKTLHKFDMLLEAAAGIFSGIVGGYLLWHGIIGWMDHEFYGIPLAGLGVALCVSSVRWLLSFLP